MVGQTLKTAARQLVDPEFFTSLEDLSLIARTVVDGFLHGLHRSPYVGFSLEFASHREYLRGDDLRHLNWKLFGRQDKLYVKQYDAETNLDLHLLIDWSGSMKTESAEMSKQRYAACLAAAIAHLALMQHDAVGLTLFSSVIQEHLPPRAKSGQLNEILHALVRIPPRPHGESARVLHEAVELMPRRGLAVLVSDLFYDPADLFSVLDHLRFRGHDVLIFQILDPLERRLPVGGSVRFQELEAGRFLVTQADEIRPAYEAAIERWLADLDRGCQTRDLDRVLITTDEPLVGALHNYLARRAGHY
jgi:uncharacterized protein (DUF58 family)